MTEIVVIPCLAGIGFVRQAEEICLVAEVIVHRLLGNTHPQPAKEEGGRRPGLAQNPDNFPSVAGQIVIPLADIESESDLIFRTVRVCD